MKYKVREVILHLCEYLITKHTLSPEFGQGYQIKPFHNNLAGIQWVKLMCVRSVKEGTDFSQV